MHAARRVQVGLVHKAGALAVAERHATGAAAEQSGPVGGAQAVVKWPKLISNWPGPSSAVITLASTPCSLAASTISCSTSAKRDRRSMCMFGWSSASPHSGSRGTAAGRLAAWVEQVELQLEGHHRANAACFQAFEHTGEHFTRLEFDRRSGAVGADQHLPQRLAFPAHRLGAGDQPARRVRSPVVEAVIANRCRPPCTPSSTGSAGFSVAAGGGLSASRWGSVCRRNARDVQADQVDITHFGWAARKRRLRQAAWGMAYCHGSICAGQLKPRALGRGIG